MQLFYSKDIACGGLYTLDAEESRHAVKVLRMRAGDAISVADGRGHLYRCRIVQADDRVCVVECEGEVDSVFNSHCSLTLAVAPTKNPARMEWLVEKAVEVGVGEVVLVECDHSERAFLKTDRLERIALSAMKQSLHTVLPRIVPPVKLRDWLDSSTIAITQSSIQRFIAHCEAGSPRTPLGQALQPGGDAVVLIGPEGDFSPNEIELALAAGFRPVSLGPSRLRTETAALYAVAAFNLINDRTP